MDESTRTEDGAAARLRLRYPPPRVSRRAKAVLVAVGTVVALAWLVWAALVYSRPAVAGQVAGYVVTSDTSMTVTVTVERRDPSVAATCRVVAQSTDFQVVADKVVTIEAGTVKLVNTQVDLTTLRRATSATVKSCVSS